jgi:hypothetical protein
MDLIGRYGTLDRKNNCFYLSEGILDNLSLDAHSLVRNAILNCNIVVELQTDKLQFIKTDVKYELDYARGESIGRHAPLTKRLLDSKFDTKKEIIVGLTFCLGKATLTDGTVREGEFLLNFKTMRIKKSFFGRIYREYNIYGSNTLNLC